MSEWVTESEGVKEETERSNMRGCMWDNKAEWKMRWTWWSEIWHLWIVDKTSFKQMSVTDPCAPAAPATTDGPVLPDPLCIESSVVEKTIQKHVPWEDEAAFDWLAILHLAARSDGNFEQNMQQKICNEHDCKHGRDEDVLQRAHEACDCFVDDHSTLVCNSLALTPSHAQGTRLADCTVLGFEEFVICSSQIEEKVSCSSDTSSMLMMWVNGRPLLSQEGWMTGHNLLKTFTNKTESDLMIFVSTVLTFLFSIDLLIADWLAHQCTPAQGSLELVTGLKFQNAFVTEFTKSTRCQQEKRSVDSSGLSNLDSTIHSRQCLLEHNDVDAVLMSFN